ncbi:MAG: tripartite tricarboxylate transporter substrate binding protein [Treponemataceae bacterium]
MKRVILAVLSLTVIGFAYAGGAKDPAPTPSGWRPTKPITIIVPWGAGGSTDQVTRITAGELETALGQKIVILNQPGASGSVGTKSVIDATKDGYTWAAGAAVDVGVYKLMGMLDTSIKDWNLFLSVANISVVSVNADSPYKTLDDLFAALKDKPGQITVATAGLSSAGHLAIEMIRKNVPFEYKHVTYDGGNPAVIACVSGETVAVTQLAVEQADMIRAKKLRPLAVLSESPLTLKGYGEIPPITKWIPSMKVGSNYFGIFLPKGTPQEVIDTVTKLWGTTVMNSPKLKEYAVDRGAVFNPSSGAEAQKRAMDWIQPIAWLYFEAGKAKVSPDTVGIPKP